MVSIKLPQSQISPQTKIPTQVEFYFSDRDLAEPQPPTRLKFSPQLLGDLRYYSLRPAAEPWAGSSLSFTSYHLRESQAVAVIRSKISLQGTIEQQICRAYLQQPELLQPIANQHYWLIEHICDRLELNYQPKSKLLAIILTATIASFSLLITLFLPWAWPWKLLTLGVLVIVVYWLCDRLITRYLALLIGQQLLFGVLAHTSARRRFGWLLWRYFG